ncbi:MAG: GTP-binding protein [Ignavibacteria bacterium]|nr:GTP-binding protein [Ignavibacteria bacterium]
MKFIDTAQIEVKAGHGGPGHISFRREKYVPKGGPDGGNGGAGGSIILRADASLNTLSDFRYKLHYQAKDGQPGGKNRCSGKMGSNLIIRVPCGVVVYESGTNQMLIDITENGEEIVMVKGGKGGRGNAEFATSTNQTPRYAESGLPGEELSITLELKLLADIGLIGLPNVGKSTLISVISEAKPKIADYPFTTLIPNLGIVKIADGKSFTCADIPGLIEGAHQGKGLGIEFLRHIERTRCLVYLIDAMSETPKEDYITLKNELKSFNPALVKKSKIVCFSRVDAIPEEKIRELKKTRFEKGLAASFYISSVTGQSIKELKMAMWEQLSET